MMNKILFLISFFPIYCLAQLPSQTGYAVYYADYFQGKPTANGEIYDAQAYTAASRQFDFGSIIRVYRLDDQGHPTGQSVIVRVNDRGPFAENCPACILDLSWIAADDIGLTLDGKSAVLIEQVGYSKTPIHGKITGYEDRVSSSSGDPSIINSYSRSIHEFENTSTSVESRSSNYEQDGKQLRSKGVGNPSKLVQDEAVLVFGYNSEAANVMYSRLDEDINWIGKNMGGYGLQISSFTDQSNAVRYYEDLKQQGISDIGVKLVSGEDGKDYYKIIKGHYSTHAEADAALYKLQKETRYRGFVYLLSR